MKETWGSQEVPVLTAAVELTDEMYPASHFPEGQDISDSAGLSIEPVGVALNALVGDYLEV